MYNDELTAAKWALNSAVECHLHTSDFIQSSQQLNWALRDCLVLDKYVQGKTSLGEVVFR
jgi:hypothetical protein